LAGVRRALFWIGTATAGGAVAGGGYLATHDVWNSSGLGDYLRRMDAERAHELAVKGVKYRLAAPGLRWEAPEDDPVLKVGLWGIQLSNPVGLAAGFDKHAEAIPGLFALGFGLVEVGTITPRAQKGNAKPRVWRLEEDAAIINCYGFPSVGLKKVQRRLDRLDGYQSGALGVNVGINKNSEDAIADFRLGVEGLGKHCDYIVINVSSPNTKGLRTLQRRDSLKALLEPIIAERNRLAFKPPLLVKIAPDLDDGQLRDIAAVAMELELDGIIISNTTIKRADLGLSSEYHDKPGGLSGRPLKEMSTEMISRFYVLTNGTIPIVGVGGIESGADAYAKIKAGASIVQIYTALIYQGPWMIDRLKEQLAQLIKKDGYSSMEDVIGADHAKIKRKRFPIDRK